MLQLGLICQSSLQVATEKSEPPSTLLPALAKQSDAVPGLNLQLPSALTAILTARRPEAALQPSGEVVWPLFCATISSQSWT